MLEVQSDTTKKDITELTPLVTACIEHASHTPKILHSDNLLYMMYSLIMFPDTELQQALHTVSEQIRKKFPDQFSTQRIAIT